MALVTKNAEVVVKVSIIRHDEPLLFHELSCAQCAAMDLCPVETNLKSVHHLLKVSHLVQMPFFMSCFWPLPVEQQNVVLPTA